MIVGGGMVGAVTALLLAKKTDLQIAILEVRKQPDQKIQRISAISPAAQSILQSINAWEAIANSGISTYTAMQVCDAGGSGVIHFASEDLNESVLGFIIEDKKIHDSLLAQFSAYPNLHFICPVQLQAFDVGKDNITVTTATDEAYQAQCVIAADGATSWVRDQAGITVKSWEYGQTAIVATVKTSLPHQQTAYQRFLPTGPLAFLPLQDAHECSIVWSVVSDKVHDLLTLADDDFRPALAQAFNHQLGHIESVSVRQHFPLHMRHAKHYVQSRVALVGDAAHTIHPLAGQGVNLGLLDAHHLVKVMVAALQKKRQFYSLATLRKYERVRKSENLTMLAMVDILKNLFGSEKAFIQSLRNAGLRITNRLDVMKNFLVRYAAGNKFTT